MQFFREDNLFRSFGKNMVFCAVSCRSSAIDAVLRVLLIIELLSDLGKLFQETNPLGELISDSNLYVKDILVPRETTTTQEIFEAYSRFHVKQRTLGNV